MTQSYTPGDLVIVTGSELDSSDPDTVCWLGTDPTDRSLVTVTKGTTGVVLGTGEENVQILLDTSATVWTWTDQIRPA